MSGFFDALFFSSECCVFVLFVRPRAHRLLENQQMGVHLRESGDETKD